VKNNAEHQWRQIMSHSVQWAGLFFIFTKTKVNVKQAIPEILGNFFVNGHFKCVKKRNDDIFLKA
jgi:hypothetical protein